MMNILFDAIWKKITILFMLVLFVSSFVIRITINNSVVDFEEMLIGDKLATDINYINDLIGPGEWHVEDGFLLKGDTNIGNGTEATANFTPFLDMEKKSGTFSYVFKRTSDEGLTWAGNHVNGYQQGHFLRVAGSTKNPNGESIVGTYISKAVADELDANDFYMGEANVDGGYIFCIYKTLKNEHDEVVGAIVVGRNVSELKEMVSYVEYTVDAILIMVFVFTTAIMLSFSRRFTSSINKVVNYLEKISTGNVPENYLYLEEDDEMSAVANSINSLVDSLKENRVLKLRTETDALTGLYNRAWLEDNLEKMFNHAIENDEWFGVELLDIDYFKQVNDNYGHDYGDECIKGIANELNRVADRKTVYAARYGGDEFVIIYTKINIFQVRSIIETIHNNIHKLHLKHEFSPIAKCVTISQGAVCGIPKQEQTIRYYMNRADETLYEVKKVGKNNFGVSPVNREHI